MATRKLPDEALEFFRKQGSKGGKKSAANMTPEERAAKAKRAAQAITPEARKARAKKAAESRWKAARKKK